MVLGVLLELAAQNQLWVLQWLQTSSNTFLP
jgi:hypothetical protein